MRILPLQKFLSLIVVMCAAVVAFAQPANDDCSTPTLIEIGADAASCVPVAGDTRGTVDATTVEGPNVCSGSWYTDDVWYSIETGATVPEFGVTVEIRLDENSGTDLVENGMGIYESCEIGSEPIFCFSNEPGRRTLSFPPQCLEPNSTYLVRVWSAPDPTTFSGTFAICAYASEDPGTGSNEARVIYEATFDDGFDGWTNVATTTGIDCVTEEEFAHDWVWTNTGCTFDFGGGNGNCLVTSETACTEIGALAMPGGYYQTGRSGDVSCAGSAGNPPYDDIFSYIVSPSIDLSKEACVNVTWTEAHRGLNGNPGRSETGPVLEYSIDGGDTWLAPSSSTGSVDISANYGGEYFANGPASNGLQRSVTLLGAQGNTDVRIRFGFEGDFYFWIIDDVRVVEGTAADIVAQSNFYARSHTNPMSIHQLDSFDFLIDVANLACEDQTNVNVNVTGVNSAGAEVHNVNLPYGLIESDSLAENQAFSQPFTPEATADSYTFTYTLTSDNDDDLSNNVRSFGFDVVDETVFRKEDGVATGQLSPNTELFWPNGGPFGWELGNMFYASSGTAVTGEQLQFTDVSFVLANPDEMAGEQLTVWIYKVEDADFDGIVAKEGSELTRLAFGGYDVTGQEGGTFTTVGVIPWESDADLLIQPGTHYMVTVQSNPQTANGISMSIAESDAYDYSAAIFAARQAANFDYTQTRYCQTFGINDEGELRLTSTGDISTTNFTDATSPLIRASYQTVVDDAVVDINEEVNINVAPNPASSDITVDLSVENPTDMEVSIVSLTGQIVQTKSFDNVTELRENFNVSNLASGVYMIHIDTKDGVQTKKFVVSQ